MGWLLAKLLTRIVFRGRITGRENLPSQGAFILASNHTSYYDPPFVGCWTHRLLFFMAKEELFRNRLFGAIIRSTNALPLRRGTIDRRALEMSLEQLKQGHGLTIFPEGTRSKGSGFLPPKAGIGMIARRAGCPIVPVYIHGSDRLTACFFGREKLSITDGEPFSSEWVKSFSDDKGGYTGIAQAVMQRIGELRDRAPGVKTLTDNSDK